MTSRPWSYYLISIMDGPITYVNYLAKAFAKYTYEYIGHLKHFRKKL